MLTRVAHQMNLKMDMMPSRWCRWIEGIIAYRTPGVKTFDAPAAPKEGS